MEFLHQFCLSNPIHRCPLINWNRNKINRNNVKDLNFAVNIAQTSKKNVMRKLLTCYSILLWILFYFSFILLLFLLLELVVFASAIVIEFVNLMSLFVCSAFAFAVNFVIVLLLILQLSREVVQKRKGKTLQLS